MKAEEDAAKSVGTFTHENHFLSIKYIASECFFLTTRLFVFIFSILYVFFRHHKEAQDIIDH